MIRYGATVLARDTWYHVAGVYDADARTLNVYLNGQPDDGSLVGPVAFAQHESSQHVCVGRRADASGYEFAGLIDDVRIDSRALSQAEIHEVMHDIHSGSRAATKAEQAPAREILAKRMLGRDDHCHQPTRSADALVPGLAAAVGVLTGLACAGFWPGYRLPILVASLAVGLLLGVAAAITLPPYVPWMIPLLSLVGGASVAVSLAKG
jgi:hypothetical protein